MNVKVGFKDIKIRKYLSRGYIFYFAEFIKKDLNKVFKLFKL